MKLVLLPEVAVAATRRSHPSHAVAQRRLERALRGKDEIVVPTTFFVEVTSALAQAGVAPETIGPILDGLTQAPHHVLTVGPRRAAHAASIAMGLKLGASEALYVAIAAKKKIPLCTLDDGLEARVAGACTVMKA